MSDTEARDKIIQAVRDLLGEGCAAEDITVRRIAQRAGVGIGTVSYHFHSKDRLVYEAVAGQMTELAATLAPGTGDGSPAERIRQFLRSTAGLALRYSTVFQIQLGYEMVHGDMDICYHITPLLKEHFGGAKSDLEIKLIALQLVTALQVILLRSDAFRRYTGTDIRNDAQREEALDIILNSNL